VTSSLVTRTLDGAVDLGDTTVLAQLPTSDAATLAAGSRVALAIRPDPVLVSADATPAAGEEA
jgi:hypothetical protein